MNNLACKGLRCHENTIVTGIWSFNPKQLNKLFCGNVKIYLHFLSYPNIEVAQVIEILRDGWQQTIYLAHNQCRCRLVLVKQIGGASTVMLFTMFSQNIVASAHEGLVGKVSGKPYSNLVLMQDRGWHISVTETSMMIQNFGSIGLMSCFEYRILCNRSARAPIHWKVL